MPSTPMVSVEISNSVGVETSKQPDAVRKCSDSRKEPLAFKKKLEDCIKADDTPYGVPTVNVDQTDNTQDNSMTANLTDTKEQPQIVGILEGFGLLDNQSNLPLVSSADSQTANEQAVNQAALELLQGLSTEQTGALEKYARMLSNDQLSQLPVEMQQAIAKAVGDYLGSFESTNNQPVQTPAAQDAQVMPVTTQVAETATDISALSDKIASLLIKLKAAQQDAKSTNVASETVQTPVLEAAVSAEKPGSVAAKPAEPQMTTQAVTSVAAEDKSAASQEISAAVKPDAKTLSSNTETTETQSTNTAVNLQSVSTKQAGTDGVQQAAKAPQTSGTDFVKDNVMRIVDKMSTQVSDGKCDFDVELKPDFLGKVNIKLSMQNGEIRMQIKTDDLNVKSMFADQASSLQAMLKDKGIAVTNIDVTYQSQMQTGADQRSYSQNDGGKKQNGRGGISLEQITGTGVFETMSQITGFTHSGSSVEYLA